MATNLGPLDPDPSVRYAAFDHMRAVCPVHELGGGRFMALSHHSVATGLRSIDKFGGSAGQAGLPEDDTTIAGILEPRHGQIRRILNAVVALHRSQQIEPYLRQFCEDRIRETVSAAEQLAGEPFDVLPAYVDPLPPAAMARLMGFAEHDSTRYYAWGNELGAEFGRAVQEGRSIAIRDACPAMTVYVEEQIAARRAMPVDSWPNDALTRFLTTEVDGERLTDRAITTQVIFAIGAGAETTRNTLASILYRLAGDPAFYARLRADRSLIDRVIEEGLRIDSPAQFLVRRCLVPEFDLEGSVLHESESVMLSIGSANRDGAVFPEPHRFDPERDNVLDHLAFGAGPHICPGAALARMEMRIALDVWCDHVVRFELADDFSWTPPQTGMLHGPVALPVVLAGAGDL